MVALIVAVMVLAAALAAQSAWLIHRQHVRDHRDEIERQGVCAVLLQIPLDRRTPAIDTALTDFHC